jgi:MFS family permease
MVAHTTSLKYRPIFSAITGGVECMALALGPFLSGAIAHYASWRISFYIIIPSSALGIVVVFFSIGHLRKSGNEHLTNRDVLKKIDWIGFGISVPMTLTLVLALQWGGTVHAWSDWRIILLLVLAGVLTAFFIFWERRAKENSMIPLKMLKQRSVALASIITFCNFAHLSVVAYYVSMLADQIAFLDTDLICTSCHYTFKQSAAHPPSSLASCIFPWP